MRVSFFSDRTMVSRKYLFEIWYLLFVRNAKSAYLAELKTHLAGKWKCIRSAHRMGNNRRKLFMFVSVLLAFRSNTFNTFSASRKYCGKNWKTQMDLEVSGRCINNQRSRKRCWLMRCKWYWGRNRMFPTGNIIFIIEFPTTEKCVTFCSDPCH